jgi:hypothetical protein
MNLYQFLSEPKAQNPCRMCAMDFRAGMDRPEIRTALHIDQLSSEIYEEPASIDECGKPDQEKPRIRAKAFQGRMIVIEDLSREVIELLGTELDIDPLFFALHLHTVHRTSSRHQTPDEAALPSRLLSENFTNISYHRAVASDISVLGKGRFLRRTTISRKLVFLRSTNIALAQHCASIIRVKRKNRPWLGE